MRLASSPDASFQKVPICSSYCSPNPPGPPLTLYQCVPPPQRAANVTSVSCVDRVLTSLLTLTTVPQYAPAALIAYRIRRRRTNVRTLSNTPPPLKAAALLGARDIGTTRSPPCSTASSFPVVTSQFPIARVCVKRFESRVAISSPPSAQLNKPCRYRTVCVIAELLCAHHSLSHSHPRCPSPPVPPQSYCLTLRFSTVLPYCSSQLFFFTSSVWHPPFCRTTTSHTIF